MLQAPDGTPITSLAHKEKYEAALKRLTPQEQNDLKNELLKLIASGTNHNSNVLGSKNINNPNIYTLLLKASGGEVPEIGRCFGLFLYATFMDLEEQWTVKKCKPKGRLDFAGLDYYLGKEVLKKKYLRT
jgi:hypothetical protein